MKYCRPSGEETQREDEERRRGGWEEGVEEETGERGRDKERSHPEFG